MFGSRISAGATEKLPDSGKGHEQVIAWSYDMQGHAQKNVERYCVLANKSIEQLYKVCTPCLDDHQFKPEEVETVGELSKSMLPNRLTMPLCGAHRQTRHPMVSEQTCFRSHQMDKSL